MNCVHRGIIKHNHIAKYRDFEVPPAPEQNTVFIHTLSLKNMKCKYKMRIPVNKETCFFFKEHNITGNQKFKLN